MSDGKTQKDLVASAASAKTHKDPVASGGGAKVQKDAGSDEESSQQAAVISQLFSKFMTQFDDKLDRLRASMVVDIKAIDSKVEAMALKENVGPASCRRSPLATTSIFPPSC